MVKNRQNIRAILRKSNGASKYWFWSLNMAKSKELPGLPSPEPQDRALTLDPICSGLHGKLLNSPILQKIFTSWYTFPDSEKFEVLEMTKVTFWILFLTYNFNRLPGINKHNITWRDSQDIGHLLLWFHRQIFADGRLPGFTILCLDDYHSFFFKFFGFFLKVIIVFPCKVFLND